MLNYCGDTNSSIVIVVVDLKTTIFIYCCCCCCRLFVPRCYISDGMTVQPYKLHTNLPLAGIQPSVKNKRFRKLFTLVTHTHIHIPSPQTSVAGVMRSHCIFIVFFSLDTLRVVVFRGFSNGLFSTARKTFGVSRPNCWHIQCI